MNQRTIRPSQRVALITGAAGGLGHTVATRFSEAGWRLALLARPRQLPQLADTFPEAVTVAAELLDAEATQRAVRSAFERTARIDALVHLVGGFAMQAALDLTPAELDDQLDINLRTAVHASQAVLPIMLAQGGGFIAAVSARAAVYGGARMPAYAAAKAALAGYLASLRAELSQRGIGVSVLVPMGAVDTPDNRAAMPDADPDRWIDPGELADALLFLADRGPRGRVAELRVSPPA